MDPNKPNLGWQQLGAKPKSTDPKTPGAARIDRFTGLAQALFEESSDAWILCDLPTERVMDLNAAAQRLCGIGLTKLLDSPLASLLCTRSGVALQSISFPTRRVQLPHSKHELYLRTAQEGIGVPVDVSVVRLSLKSTRIALLSLRPISTDSESSMQFSHAVPGAGQSQQNQVPWAWEPVTASRPIDHNTAVLRST